MGMSYEEYIISIRNRMRLKYKGFKRLEPIMHLFATTIPADNALWEKSVPEIYRGLYELALVKKRRNKNERI